MPTRNPWLMILNIILRNKTYFIYSFKLAMCIIYLTDKSFFCMKIQSKFILLFAFPLILSNAGNWSHYVISDSV